MAAIMLLAVCPVSQAQAQNCPRPGSDTVDQGYHFAFDAFDRRLPDRRQIVYCVVNRHSTLNVWVDWPDAGLKGWVRVGRSGSAVRNGPAGRSVSFRDGVLWFGAQRQRSVTTPIFASGPATAGGEPRGQRPRVLTAAFQDAPTAPEDIWTSSGSIDVPLSWAYGQSLLNNRSRLVARRTALDRIALRRLFRILETRPEALVPFEMTFRTQTPTETGEPGLRYICTYKVEARVLLRFDDPALHRAMFGQDGPVRASAWGGRMQVMRSQLIDASAGLEPRTARLEILLQDGATVIGTIGVDYLAPSGH